MERYGYLRTLRLSRGMTQTQVGILAGMSKSQVSRMENGTLGSPDTADRVLAALGYERVVSYRDIRPEPGLKKDRILSDLKVYYLYNKERLGIERIGLFGSYVRGEEKPDSDIDIVISLKNPSLFRYSEIQEQLQIVFGCKVDLISDKAHKSKEFQTQIDKEAIYVS